MEPMHRMNRGVMKRIAAVVFAFGVVTYVVACGSSARRVPLAVPPIDMPVSMTVKIPHSENVFGLPLITILDDGPPVDVTLTHPQRYTIDQLETMLLREGYPVWRPFRELWQSGELTVHCPDRLVSWTLLGLRAARDLPQIDESKMIVLGFGQGGIVGLAAARRSTDLTYAVGIIGTPARSIDIVLTSPALRDSVTRRRLLDTFGRIWANEYPDTTIVMHGEARCWRSWLQITKDMLGLVDAVEQPVLAVQGTADTLLPMLDIERFRYQLRRRPMSRAEVALGVKHDLRDEVPDLHEDPDRISPRVVEPIMRWIREVIPLPEQVRSR